MRGISEGAASARGRYALRAAIFTGAFLILAWANRSGMTAEIDRAFAAELRTIRIPEFEPIAEAVAWIGRTTPTLGFAAVLAAVLFRRRGSWAWIAPLFILLVAVVEFVVKQSFSRPPGGREVMRAIGELFGDPFRTPGSFPSGHVARLSFLAGISTAALPPLGTVLLIGVTAITFIGRMYVGSHRLSDALGGALLGMAVSSAAQLWLSRRPESRPRPSV